MMKIIRTGLLSVLFSALTLSSVAQKDQNYSSTKNDKTTLNSQNEGISPSSRKGSGSLGIGAGLPYGGFGIRFGINTQNYFNIFGGIGYQVAGIGYNFGIRKDFKSRSNTQFYLQGMYGTNAAIKIIGLSSYDQLYTGATVGLGIKINSRKIEGNYWDLGLLLPFKSSSFENDNRRVKNDPRIAEYTEPPPILITVGYNFKL